MKLPLAFLASSLTLLSSPSFATPSDILFILDGSGSMWGQIDGTSKIQTAKETMNGLLDSVPQDARIGIMTYGTRDKASCSDISLLNAIGTDRNTIKSSIAGLKPLGKTPIEKSLVAGIATLASSQPFDTQKSLVLVSDGIESCDGNPCAVASSAAKSGVGLKVHVVGFDVDAQTRSQLECIAENGGGQYFNAANTDGFKRAMEAVIEVAQASATEPIAPAAAPTPSAVEVFRDDFDGDDLADHWTVSSPDPDNYIVDDGQLTIVSSTDSRFQDDETQRNRFDLNFELPKGDWDIEVKFNIEYQDLPQSEIYLGSGEGRNKVFAKFQAGPRDGRETRPGIYTVRQSGDNKPVIQSNSLISDLEDLTFGFVEKSTKHILNDQQLTMTFQKRGRDYQTQMKFIDGNGDEQIRTTDPVTQLRAPKNISLFFTLYKGLEYTPGPSGDSVALIDSVVISKVE